MMRLMRSAPLAFGTVAATCLAAGALAGCATSTAPSGAQSTAVAATPAGSAPSTSASAPASASASGGTSQAAPSASGSPSEGTGGAPAGCATRDLQAKAGEAQGTAGSLYQVIDFTNISASACTLYGYPGVALAAGTPVTQVGAAASRSTASKPTLVTLDAGQTANALLRITQAVNYPAQTCQPKATTYLQIYPPNQTTPIYLQYSSTGCASEKVILLIISAVQDGDGNSAG
jgi:hypothetical protein